MVLLVLCLAGGAAWLWRYIHRPGNSNTLIVEGALPTTAPTDAEDPVTLSRLGGARGMRAVADGVQRMGGAWRVKSGNTQVTVRATIGGEPDCFFHYFDRDFLTPEMVRLLSVQQRVIYGYGGATWGDLRLSPQQVEQLRQAGSAGMQVSPEDLHRFRGLFNAYQNSTIGISRLEAQKALLAAVNDIAYRSLDATRRAYAQRVEKIRSILTPRQLEALFTPDAAWPDGVHEVHAGRRWVVKAGRAGMQVDEGPSAQPAIQVRYFPRSETRELQSLVELALSDASAAATAELTAAQLAQLRALGTPALIKPTDEQLQRLRGLWSTYRQAEASARPAAGDALVSALGEIGRKGLEEARQGAARWNQSVGRILSVAQIQGLRKAIDLATRATSAPASTQP